MNSSTLRGLRLEMLLSWEIDEKQGKSEKWSGEGAKRVWGPSACVVLRKAATQALWEPQGRNSPNPLL